MKNFLKSTVIILGVLIILLFIITVFAITKKYNQNNVTDPNIVLNPKLEFNEKIKSFYVEKNKLYILIEFDNDDSTSIQIYDLNTGKLVNRINIK